MSEPRDATIAEHHESLAVDGDAGSYLEELIACALQPIGPSIDASEALVTVELAGPHLRIAGGIRLGRFRRLSDVLNHHEGLLQLQDSTALRRNGAPTKVTTPHIWVNPREVSLVGQPEDAATAETPPEMRIAKEAHLLIVVTPGHILTGEVYIPGRGGYGVVHRIRRPGVPPDDRRPDAIARRSPDHHPLIRLRSSTGASSRRRPKHCPAWSPRERRCANPLRAARNWPALARSGAGGTRCREEDIPEPRYPIDVVLRYQHTLET